MPDPIVIADYDPHWPALFEQLRDQLRPALGELALRIEHIGSTAVPGLAAKPVIDIDIVIRTRDDLPAVIDRLATLDYTHQGHRGIPDREAFAPPANLPPHHVYVCPADADPCRQHLAFRDFLRANPETAKAYGQLKRTLAEQYGNDREGYTNAKTFFIETTLRRATAPA